MDYGMARIRREGFGSIREIRGPSTADVQGGRDGSVLKWGGSPATGVSAEGRGSLKVELRAGGPNERRRSPSVDNL